MAVDLFHTLRASRMQRERNTAEEEAMNDKLDHFYVTPRNVTDARDKMEQLHKDWRDAPANERGPLYSMYDEARSAYVRALHGELLAIREQMTQRERELLDRSRAIINTIGGLS